MTYASAFDAAILVWIAESLRDEHRQALEWLNQRSDADTQFFGVVPEVLRIDDSRPAYRFRAVVFPNEWRKEKRSSMSDSVSPRAESYRLFFQRLIDVLREKHRFTNARVGQPQNWYTFASGNPGFSYGTSFAQGGRVRAEVYIDLNDTEETKAAFDELCAASKEIEEEFGSRLEWERLNERRASRIATYRKGSIESSPEELDEIQSWMVEMMLRFKKVLGERILMLRRE